MKRKCIQLLSALAVCALLLACLPAGYAAERDRVSAISVSPAVSLSSEIDRLTDSQADKLQALCVQQPGAASAAAAAPKQTQVQERDWSKYASKGAVYRLSGGERTLYEMLDSACLSYLKQPSLSVDLNGEKCISQEINFADLGLTPAQAGNVYAWFRLNNPQYYFASGFWYGDTSLYIRIYQFVSALPDQGKAVNDMFHKLDSWIAACSGKDLSAWDKVIAINKKLCESTKYNPAVASQGADALTDESQTLYSILLQSDTVCAGYADAFNAMASALGVESYNVHSDSHRWNVVRLEDGQYYMVDVTWNDRGAAYSYNYMGVGTTFVAKDDPARQHVYSADIKAYAPAVPEASYCGYGRMVLSDGTVYTGGWKDGCPEGYGKSELTDGSVFEGEWRDGQKNGLGTYKWASGDYYEGLWADGERTFGIYTWPSGSFQLGGWKSGKPNGASIQVSANGTVKAGQWKDGTLVQSGSQLVSFLYASGVYTGEVKNGVPHGIGRMVSSNGETYFGEWTNGQLTGHGRYTWTDGTVYFGDFQAGKMNGSGTCLATNGNIYVGEYQNNVRTGAGKLIWKDGSSRNGDVYIGTFRDGVINGVGTYSWQNGNVYQGQFQNDMRDGWGKYACFDGSQYTGDTYAGYFEAGSRSGYGTYTWAGGTVYEGEWNDNLRHGFGLETAPNGQQVPGQWKKDAYVAGSGRAFVSRQYQDSTYYGELKDGQPHGYGRMTYQDGSVYAGQFQDGVFAGSGVFLWKGSLQPFSESYLGSFAAGKRSGTGTYTWTNGNRFDGTWKDGSPNGAGVLIEADGDVYTGDWKDGQRTGTGTMQYSNGDVYAGDWVQNVRCGTGTLTEASGAVYKGQWKDGKFLG